ncbi:MAG: DUF4912 domain-containing protein [Verrucomicrobia bacterium]|nr:DUF4912 domain-containing protein [Verrucomicrobiota bacterium]
MKTESARKTVKPAAAHGARPPSGRRKSGKRPARVARNGAAIPPILLEGDAGGVGSASGPGGRFVLGPRPPAEGRVDAVEDQELPEAYGTRRLLLTARDPHWVYACWDLTRDQQRRYNKSSADGHLVLRIYRDSIEGEPVHEIAVHPESRNWFVNVGCGGTRFQAELGYYQRGRKWARVSTSGVTLTPPDTMSDDLSLAFETLPVELQFSQLVDLVKVAVSRNVPLLEAIQQLRATGYPGLPERGDVQARRWTPEQEAVLARIVNMDAVRRIWMGSLEITEVIRRQLHQEMWSAAAAQLGQAGLWSGALSSIGSVSSPFGLPGKPQSFWFNVNAELVIYGATEPDAQVTIGGRPIKLRQDGTFSYRFALPDGNYFLPAVAKSANGEDQRVAELAFRRGTHYQGEVGRHPQDPALKPPRPDDLS